MNIINVSGIVADFPKFSHETYGEKFYRFDIHNERNSGVFDEIPCIVSEFLLNKIVQGEMIWVSGEIRSRNFWKDSKRRTEITVFVKNVYESDGKFINHFELHGFVCKEPTYRFTPLGREITDLIIASNRLSEKKADYLPCIAWGRLARCVSEFKIGTELRVFGRFQSREYTKNINEEFVVKTAYELSVKSLDVVEKE